MRKFLSLLPPRVKDFLLDQPLPDAWLDALRHRAETQDQQPEALHKPDAAHYRSNSPTPQEKLLTLNRSWRESYGLLLALVVLLLAALVLYSIMS